MDPWFPAQLVKQAVTGDGHPFGIVRSAPSVVAVVRSTPAVQLQLIVQQWQSFHLDDDCDYSTVDRETIVLH